MKKIIIILMYWAFNHVAFTQDTQPAKVSNGTNVMKTLIEKDSGTNKIPLGYFIEIYGGYSQFGLKSVFLPGVSLGLILNHNWTIGITGNFIGNTNGLHFHNIYFDSTSLRMHGANLNGGCGGLLLEYTLFPRSRIHIAFPLMIGSGYMYYSPSHHYNSTTHSNHDWQYIKISRDYFFVVEPGVRVEFNIVKIIRVGLGISYRYTPDLDLINTSPDLINQFTGELNLRFGKF
jgi:hypothetical protein